MEHRRYVSFEWDTEDDGEFDAAGDVIAPGGRNILEHIRGRLRQRGFQVTDIVMHEFYGWTFDAVADRVPVWCMIQYAEPWLLVINVPLPLLQRVRGRKPAAQQSRVCTAIHEVLVSGGRARTIRWFSRREYNQNRGKGGADRP